jgi:hypothetical protein
VYPGEAERGAAKVAAAPRRRKRIFIAKIFQQTNNDK